MLLVLLTVLAVTQSLTQESSGLAEECQMFNEELHSRPDFAHKVMTASLPLPPDFAITAVEIDVTKRRSFYWCEMQVNDGPDHGGSKSLRRFGHNSTHWWVTDGCGGWFTITACRNDPTIDTKFNPSTTNSPRQTEHNHNTRIISDQPVQSTDINSGALLALYSWLQEQGNTIPIHKKLGVDPNSRVVRSVDEEFALEFGD